LKGTIDQLRNSNEHIDVDNDGFITSEDCDDYYLAINPGAREIPCTSIDEDCNPATLDDDLDQDGFLLADDCDDTDADINPDAIDIPDNDIDEDCNGSDFTSSIQSLLFTYLKIYPNPATDFLYIEAGRLSSYSTSIYNTQGQSVIDLKNTTTIDVSNLTKGIYFLHIEEVNSSVELIQKIVIH